MYKNKAVKNVLLFFTLSIKDKWAFGRKNFLMGVFSKIVQGWKQHFLYNFAKCIITSIKSHKFI